MYCTRCGCPLTGGYSTSKTGRKYGYYSCRKNALAHKDCINKSISKDWIENKENKKTVELKEKNNKEAHEQFWTLAKEIDTLINKHFE